MPTPFELSLSGATWIDSNSRVNQVALPDRIPDDLAIVNSLFNLFNCAVGERGKIFQPEYGSEWKRFLQEPVDEITAAKMRIAMIQSVARWEPRIILDYSKTSIVPVYDLPGYQVRVYGMNTLTKQPIDIRWLETAG